MRNGQNKRMRGRNNNNHVHNSSNNHGQHRKSHNPMARVYESNGPEVKIRGNPAHIAEKYMQLARDAQTSGDPISAENYFQHAEHYFRLIATAQEQFRQNNPHLPRQETEITGARDEGYGEGGDDDDDTQPQQQSGAGPVEAPYGTGEQPYLPRDAQPFPHREQPQPIARAPQPAPVRSRAAATSTGCRPSSPVDRARPSLLSRAMVRTATTRRANGSRCIAGGGAIAGRATRPPRAARAAAATNRRARNNAG